MLRPARFLPAALYLLLAGPAASAQPHPPPRVVPVADRVWLFITPAYGDVGLDGNAVAVAGDDGVLVFDANGTPAAARAVVAAIRGLTGLPVRFLVLSHWHWDHWYGAEAYREAWPGLRIISHERTRRLMQGPAQAFNRPGLESQLPQHLAAVERRAAQADSAQAADRDAWRTHARRDRFFLEQKQGARPPVADLTFTDSLTIHLGSRRVRVLHHDRAVTPGDAFLYLPEDRIAIVGDLVVNPIPFALSSYPAGWLRTLERLDALPFDVLVPGHGEPLHDRTLLRAHLAIMRELFRVGRDAKARGESVEQARSAAMALLRDRMVGLTGDRPADNQAFEIYLVDWFLHRVFEELDGPLTDDIAPIPTHPPAE